MPTTASQGATAVLRSTRNRQAEDGRSRRRHRQLTRFWMPLRMADMTADSGNGSFGLADDFWL